MSRSIISVDSSSNFGGHTTITSALRSNVTIYMHKGTYTENLDFTGLTGVIIYCLPGASLTGTITAQGTNKIIYAERKIYSVLLNQAGTNAPTVSSTYKNTVGTIVWTRQDAGIYLGTLTGAFIGALPDKLFFKVSTAGMYFPDTTNQVYMYKQNDNSIVLLNNVGGAGDIDLEGLILLDFEIL